MRGRQGSEMMGYKHKGNPSEKVVARALALKGARGPLFTTQAYGNVAFDTKRKCE